MNSQAVLQLVDFLGWSLEALTRAYTGRIERGDQHLEESSEIETCSCHRGAFFLWVCRKSGRRELEMEGELSLLSEG
jgi:hypothetical protein